MSRAAIVQALKSAGYDARKGGDDIRIVDLAPDSEGASTAPGSAWDEECDALAAEVAAIVAPYGGAVAWDDDDLVITVTP